jgi:6-pyruvoyltetrahydropterin/6-carboxytetrahydropterin synthase
MRLIVHARTAGEVAMPMPYATIAKEFSFDAAHQLPSSDGPCRRLHGHTYRVRVSARGRIRAVDGDTQEGMVLDFARIKEVYMRRIGRICDHQFLNEVVPVERTTAELLATWMLQELRAELPEVCAIRLYETPTSFAEVTVDDLAGEQ